MSQCVRCQAEFSCAMVDGAPDGAPCWCTALPAMLPVPEAGAAGCYCPQCLQQVIAEQGGRQLGL